MEDEQSSKQSKQSSSPPLENPTLGDDQIKAGFLLHHHWKHEHARTIWHGLKDGHVATVHSRFSTVLLCLLFLLKVAIILVNALTIYTFMYAGVPLSVFMMLFIWAASLSHDKPWQLKAASLVSTLDLVFYGASLTFTTDDDETKNNNTESIFLILFGTTIITIVMYTLFRKMVSFLLYLFNTHAT